MPFQQLPIPGTYTDVSLVTDPEHERMKLTFANGMVVMLQKASDHFGSDALVVDKANSSPSALEPVFEHCYRSGKMARKRLFEKRTVKTIAEVREHAILSVNYGYDRGSGTRSPSIGRGFGIMLGFTNEGASGYYSLAEGSAVVSIESIVLR